MVVKYKYKLESIIKLDNYGKYISILQLTDLKSKKTYSSIKPITEYQNNFYHSAMYMMAAIKDLLIKFHPTDNFDDPNNIIEIQKNIKDVQILAKDDGFIELWDVYYKCGGDYE